MHGRFALTFYVFSVTKELEAMKHYHGTQRCCFRRNSMYPEEELYAPTVHRGRGDEDLASS